ncbi:MAG TPA: glycogen synthase GlgA [Candidatus Eremiobacteraceae bacterium]|nr:glycogen synthase GlgA [Candidatus Eremiobacteraceae bacterium]
MKALFVASEIFPMAKTGGLGDVAAALPAALAGLDVDIRLLMPAYPSAMQQVRGLAVDRHFDDLAGFGPVDFLIGRTPKSDLRIWLVFCRRLFERSGGPYEDEYGAEWPDNLERFALLCQAASRIAEGIGDWRPDIVHANDWHTGLVPSLLMAQSGSGVPTLLTIHNASYQGAASLRQLRSFGIPPERLQRFGSGKLSFLSLGVQEANLLTAVSPTYAREIQTSEFGLGLEDLFAARSRDLTGILNGVDYDVWDPRHDPLIAQTYDERKLAGKSACKAALLQEFGLDGVSRAPLLAIVSRLTPQKGLDLVLERTRDLVDAGARLVVLGKGDAKLERGFREQAALHPSRVAACIRYDEALAHRIVAGADIFLMPSRFEPSGLNQMYSLRYGTVPVVAAVGGLADSIVDAGERGVAAGVTTGFCFEAGSAAAFSAAARKAMAVHADQPLWQALQRNGMRRDFGWSRAAQTYRQLYERLAPVASPRLQPPGRG